MYVCIFFFLNPLLFPPSHALSPPPCTTTTATTTGQGPRQGEQGAALQHSGGDRGLGHGPRGGHAEDQARGACVCVSVRLFFWLLPGMDGYITQMYMHTHMYCSISHHAYVCIYTFIFTPRLSPPPPTNQQPPTRARKNARISRGTSSSSSSFTPTSRPSTGGKSQKKSTRRRFGPTYVY